MANDRSASLHSESIIIDGLQISRWSEEVFHRLNQGGLTAVNATIAVHENFRDTVGNIAEWYRLFEKHSSIIAPVRTVDDIKQAKREGKVGIIFDFQDTAPIENDISLLSIYKELGVRVIQLTYMERNYVGDGCLERTDCGLSRFGLAVIEEMNRLGLLIDLSHVGHRTTMEAIEASQQPVAFTHANPRSLCDHPRNKTDEQLTAVTRKNGVVGANIFPPFLAAGSKATLEDFVDVIDYLVKLVGIDHVSVGTDFTECQPQEFFHWLLTGRSKVGQIMELEYPVASLDGIRSASEFPNITRALLNRGYAEADVKKIMGDNLFRLFETVWI